MTCPVSMGTRIRREDAAASTCERVDTLRLESRVVVMSSPLSTAPPARRAVSTIFPSALSLVSSQEAAAAACVMICSIQRRSTICFSATTKPPEPPPPCDPPGEAAITAVAAVAVSLSLTFDVDAFTLSCVV